MIKLSLIEILATIIAHIIVFIIYTGVVIIVWALVINIINHGTALNIASSISALVLLAICAILLKSKQS